MKISVITVCKNAENHLEKTLLSVFNQAYTDFEYIVIDGASSDGTLNVLEKYRDKIACVISEPDSGIYNAMNNGVKKASGDILYFLNAGDTLYDENIFSDVMNEFQKEPVRLVFGDLFFVNPDGIDENTTIIKSGRRANLSGFLFNYSLYHGTPPQPASFFKREIFEKCGNFAEEFKISSDYEFYLRILLRYRIPFKYIDRVISNFAIGGISNLSKNHHIALQEHRLILEKYPELNSKTFKKYKFFIKIVYPFIFRNFKFLIRKYNRNKLIKERINKLIAPFIGGHLNIVYADTNSITGHMRHIR